jgi:hypothetical protein
MRVNAVLNIFTKSRDYNGISRAPDAATIVLIIEERDNGPKQNPIVTTFG